MVICFECSAETKAALDGLLANGQYRDYSELLSVAVANLTVLQSHLHSKRVLVLEDDKRQSEAARPEESGQERPRERQGRAQSARRLREAQFPLLDGAASSRSSGHAAELPAIFSLADLEDVQHIKPSGLSADIWVPGQQVPLDRWLFGQYNRLLPAKASCRALLHLTKTSPAGVSLGVAAQKISEEAVILGEWLSAIDSEHGTGRDDMLSTAFPVSDEGGEKGRQRYANHFVGSVNTNGQLSGLLIDLKLVNYKKRKDPLLQLTEIGIRFACMPNPVLDVQQERPTQKFSAQEISLLQRHIRCSVPAEDFAYRAILKVIAEGADSPDAVDAALQTYAPQNTTLSTSFLTSQRSGTISRMSDLEMVTRVRQGVRVVYSITARAQEYLDLDPHALIEGNHRRSSND